MTPKVVLFDIDNTVLWTGGAGSAAMTRAFRDLYGVDDGFRNVEFSGRTDTSIFRSGLLEHGLLNGNFAYELPRFKEAYFAHLPATLRETAGGSVLPGISALLEEITRRGVHVGLETGNFRRGGEMKLEYYSVAAHLREGGFGDDSEERDEVVRIAIERVSPSPGAQVYVVGDTPHDVTAARANGAFALGVATGRSSVDQLLAAGAHAAIPDCADIERVLAILGL